MGRPIAAEIADSITENDDLRHHGRNILYLVTVCVKRGWFNNLLPVPMQTFQVEVTRWNGAQDLYAGAGQGVAAASMQMGQTAYVFSNKEGYLACEGLYITSFLNWLNHKATENVTVSYRALITFIERCLAGNLQVTLNQYHLLLSSCPIL